MAVAEASPETSLGPRGSGPATWVLELLLQIQPSAPSSHTQRAIIPASPKPEGSGPGYCSHSPQSRENAFCNKQNKTEEDPGT